MCAFAKAIGNKIRLIIFRSTDYKRKKQSSILQRQKQTKTQVWRYAFYVEVHRDCQGARRRTKSIPRFLTKQRHGNMETVQRFMGSWCHWGSKDPKPISVLVGEVAGVLLTCTCAPKRTCNIRISPVPTYSRKVYLSSQTTGWPMADDQIKNEHKLVLSNRRSVWVNRTVNLINQNDQHD